MGILEKINKLLYEKLNEKGVIEDVIEEAKIYNFKATESVSELNLDFASLPNDVYKRMIKALKSKKYVINEDDKEITFKIS